MKKKDKISGLPPTSAVTKKRGDSVLGKLIKNRMQHAPRTEQLVEVIAFKSKSRVIGTLLNRKAQSSPAIGNVVEIIASDSGDRVRGHIAKLFSQNASTVKSTDVVKLNPKTVAYSEMMKQKHKSLNFETQSSVVRIRSVGKIQNILKAFEEKSKPTQTEKKVNSTVLSREEFHALRKKNGYV